MKLRQAAKRFFYKTVTTGIPAFDKEFATKLSKESIIVLYGKDTLRISTYFANPKTLKIRIFSGYLDYEGFLLTKHAFMFDKPVLEVIEGIVSLDVFRRADVVIKSRKLESRRYSLSICKNKFSTKRFDAVIELDAYELKFKTLFLTDNPI